MASACPVVEGSEWECSVCSELFTEPKLLPCGHILCLHCLLTWMKTQSEPLCPLCRDIIISPQDQQSQSLEDIADGFPTDLALALVLEADRLLSKNHVCCVCEDVAATAMCLTCKDLFCNTCKKAHGKMSSTKHHTVEDLSALTAEILASSPQSSLCDTHPEKKAKLFCPTHGVSICVMCATSKHRSCPEVKDLGEKMEEACALLKQLVTRLTGGEVELDTAIRELDQHLQDMEKYAEAALAEIDETYDRLDAKVKERRRRLKELVVSALSEVREAVKEGKNCLLQSQTKLKTHKRVIERAEAVKKHEVVTTMSSKMKSRVDELDYSLSLPKDAKVISMFTVVLDPAAVTQIEQGLAKLGEVKVVPADIPAITKVTADIPANTKVTADIPANTKVTADIPAKTKVTADIPANTKVTADIPATTKVTADIPAKTTVTADIQAKTKVTADIPAKTKVTADIPAKTKVTADIPAKTKVTADIPANT